MIERKTIAKNKYCAIKLASIDKKPRLTLKSEIGRYKLLNLPVKKYEKEMRDWNADFTIGQQIKSKDVFQIRDIVDVTGISKGKGTAGAIKRHHFSCGPKSHGSHYHRRAGSLGSIVSNRVFKNKKNAGRMGHHQATIKNLQILAINEEQQYIIVSGLIPGPKKQIVYIHEAKGRRKQGPPIILNNFQDSKTSVNLKGKVT